MKIRKIVAVVLAYAIAAQVFLIWWHWLVDGPKTDAQWLHIVFGHIALAIGCATFLGINEDRP